jgi:alpha/beta superfamily hydrolase
MTEAPIYFRTGKLKIQGLLAQTSGNKGAVVTHPHPLYGGDMYNNVVEAVVQAYQANGYTTLRFNFRGAGQSEGGYDEGRGEQEDIRAALAYLRGLGKTDIDLAGYSFGAWVNALGLERFHDVQRLVMVSPPVNFMDFSFLGRTPKIRLVISGSHDDIGPPKMIEDLLSSWHPQAEFHVIQGADHFYWGHTADVGKIIEAFLAGAD